VPRLVAVHPVLASRDVAATLRFYERLGFQETFKDAPDRPSYAAVRRGGVELHLQWHDSAEWEHPGDRPVYRFLVEDVDGLFAEVAAQGLPGGMTEVRDTPWGTREFHLRDPDGNGLQFYVARPGPTP
jgi:catechol 2,3-dioxygenase-like lactoylglutathione lyase family enzyme